MANPVKTIDKDKGRRRILRQVKKINGSFTTVGIHAKEPPYDNGASVQMVASVHEFGSTKAGVPKRSFLRSTFDENRAAWRKRSKELMSDIFIGRLTVKKALSILGFEMTEAVRSRIVEGPFLALAESTKKQRSSAEALAKSGAATLHKPLYLSKKLWRSISFEVDLG